MNKLQDRDRSSRPSWTATHFKTGAKNSMTIPLDNAAEFGAPDSNYPNCLGFGHSNGCITMLPGQSGGHRLHMSYKTQPENS